jgi:hypothetical protein
METRAEYDVRRETVKLAFRIGDCPECVTLADGSDEAQRVLIIGDPQERIPMSHRAYATRKGLYIRVVGEPGIAQAVQVLAEVAGRDRDRNREYATTRKG